MYLRPWIYVGSLYFFAKLLICLDKSLEVKILRHKYIFYRIPSARQRSDCSNPKYKIYEYGNRSMFSIKINTLFYRLSDKLNKI